MKFKSVRNCRNQEKPNISRPKTHYRAYFGFLWRQRIGERNLGERLIRSMNILRENLKYFGLTRSIKASLDYEINEVETAIANALANYKTETAAQLAILNEQAAIARQLGIADNQAGLAALGTNGIGINVNTDMPAYLRGFKALEKEIALINNRGAGDALLPRVQNYLNKRKLRTLTTDKVKRIEKGVALTPANAENFIKQL